MKNATRTFSLNVKENINYSMKKREYTVKDLPRISKKEIDLNELKMKFDRKMDKKWKKRSKAKTVSSEVRNQKSTNRSTPKSQKPILKNKRKQSRNRNDGVAIDEEPSSRNSKKQH